jgi:hypothetical protein
MFLSELAVLHSEILPERPVPLGRVDELDLAFAVGWLAVGEDPNVGRDPSVVEHILG